jgi:hypothetical protein
MLVRAEAEGNTKVEILGETRRSILRALAGAAVLSTGVEQASAIQTFTTPKPFVADYEKYKDRSGSMLGPRQMMREKSEFNEVVKAELMAAIPGIAGAYPGLLKLAFLDAACYDLTDYPNATGGVNGSIVFSEELARPENAMAKAMVEALQPVKTKIDAAWAAKAQVMGAERPVDAISWADLIAMAGVAATILQWGGSPPGGFAVRQGREDTAVPDPVDRHLSLNADAASAKAWFKKRGIKLAAAVPVWMAVTENAESAMADEEIARLVAKYDADTTEYQKQFMTGFTQVTSLGSYFDGFAYFYDESPFSSREWYMEKTGKANPYLGGPV